LAIKKREDLFLIQELLLSLLKNSEISEHKLRRVKSTTP